MITSQKQATYFLTYYVTQIFKKSNKKQTWFLKPGNYAGFHFSFFFSVYIYRINKEREKSIPFIRKKSLHVWKQIIFWYCNSLFVIVS